VQTLAHGLRSLIDEAEAANRKEQKEQAAANKISADLPEDVSV
jgi:hypothetical protein